MDYLDARAALLDGWETLPLEIGDIVLSYATFAGYCSELVGWTCDEVMNMELPHSNMSSYYCTEFDAEDSIIVDGRVTRQLRIVITDTCCTKSMHSIIASRPRPIVSELYDNGMRSLHTLDGDSIGFSMTGSLFIPSGPNRWLCDDNVYTVEFTQP